ncbi:MAG TPA: hypothetical protein VJT49_07695 [Amycolatopsis sp.]|uniref:hypothetical protein n=1 Tax=Amycolatopsis sp. TaxID=37632 RepID=UPI002B49C42F|nr:hypothetical protein [Amycolatopsis sp.]HKS44989.1 hypothetical protein [Amycolatopsis sp.]
MTDTAASMADDRSRQLPRRSTELAGLLGPDRSVVVPGEIAGEVLRLLVFALTERARSPASGRLNKGSAKVSVIPATSRS